MFHVNVERHHALLALVQFLFLLLRLAGCGGALYAVVSGVSGFYPGTYWRVAGVADVEALPCAEFVGLAGRQNGAAVPDCGLGRAADAAGLGAEVHSPGLSLAGAGHAVACLLLRCQLAAVRGAELRAPETAGPALQQSPALGLGGLYWYRGVAGSGV